MKQNFFKFLTLTSFLGILAPGFSETSKEPSSIKAFDQGYPVEENQMAKAYNSSARIDVKGNWDFYLSGSFIYWLAKEDNLALASMYNESITPHVASMVPMETKYKPGFKVAAGMNCGSLDNWVINLEYTRLHGEYDKSASIPNITNFSFNPCYLSNGIASGKRFIDGYGEWKNHLDLIDLDLSRPFYSGSHLTVTPFFGLRGGWLNQGYDAHYQDVPVIATVFYSTSKQDTWLIGPRAGLNSRWLLGCGFRFFGDVALNLFYQRFDNHYSEHAAGASTSDKIHETTNTVTPNLQVGLGFGYGSYFSKNRYHFDLLVGYDFQIFLNQNRMKVTSFDLTDAQFDEDDAFTTSFDLAKPADLILHGLTVTARFDF